MVSAMKHYPAFKPKIDNVNSYCVNQAVPRAA